MATTAKPAKANPHAATSNEADEAAVVVKKSVVKPPAEGIDAKDRKSVV